MGYGEEGGGGAEEVLEHGEVGLFGGLGLMLGRCVEVGVSEVGLTLLCAWPHFCKGLLVLHLWWGCLLEGLGWVILTWSSSM